MFRYRGYLYRAVTMPPPGFMDGAFYRGVLYHGSDRGDLRMLEPNQGNEFGIYLTPKHRYARRYGQHLYRVLANFRNPIFVADKSELSSADLTQQDVEQLQAAGYDAIVSGGSIETASEVVLFDSSQVHILEEA